MIVIFCVLLAGTLSGAAYASYAMINNVDGAFETASILDKGVIIFFTLPTCGPCKEMRDKVFSNEEVSNLIRNHFVLVEADHNNRYTATYPPRSVAPSRAKVMTLPELFRELEIRRTPSYAFFNTRFQHVYTHTGYLEPNELLQILEYVVSPEAARGVNYHAFTSVTGKPEPRVIMKELTPLQERALRTHNRAIQIRRKEQMLTWTFAQTDPFEDHFFTGFESLDELRLFFEEREVVLHQMYLLN